MPKSNLGQTQTNERRVLSVRDALLVLAVVSIWGTNFVVIKTGLDAFPPLLFATLRFAFTVFPAILLAPRPAVSWCSLAGYGILLGPGQFGLLFIAMNGHIAPGLASLLIQMQVFFTIGLSMIIRGERLERFHVLSLILCAAGLAVIFMHVGRAGSLLGLALVIASAASWAGANIVASLTRIDNMLPYIIWASLFAVPPLILMTLWLEGHEADRYALTHAGLAAWSALAWQSTANTLFRFATWSWLLKRYPAATITPAALLVPLFGMGAASIWLGESMPPWKIAGACLLLSGLGVDVLWPILGLRCKTIK